MHVLASLVVKELYKFETANQLKKAQAYIAHMNSKKTVCASRLLECEKLT